MHEELYFKPLLSSADIERFGYDDLISQYGMITGGKNA
jgi:hypothetical protein